MNRKESADPKWQVADRSLSRMMNEKAIAEAVFEEQGISRAHLAKKLGISKPAIAANVEILMKIGLIEERGEGAAARTGGRKPIRLYINEKFRYIGALDLAFQEPVCAIADMNHHLIGLRRIRVPKEAPKADRLAAVKAAFDGILTEYQIPREKMDTIIVSRPGVFGENEMPRYLNKKHRRWAVPGLDKFLAAEYRAHLHSRNDVNVAALGEWSMGCEKHRQHLFYISCGVGIGAGLIINGELYRGEEEAAGEIGDIVLGTGERVEDYAAIDGLIAKVQQALDWPAGRRALTFTEVVRMAREGEESVKQVIYEIGQCLGRVIYNSCIVMDIHTVLFGGDYLSLEEDLFRGINDYIDSTHGLFKPRISASNLREGAGIFGCFVVGTEKVIERNIKLSLS